MSKAEILNLHLNSLGERMRFRRRELGLTQDELALLSGTNQAVIQKIENGKSLRPRKLDVIADALNITPAWLVYGDEKNTQLTPEAKKVGKLWMRLSEREQMRIQRDATSSVKRADKTPSNRLSQESLDEPGDLGFVGPSSITVNDDQNVDLLAE